MRSQGAVFFILVLLLPSNVTSASNLARRTDCVPSFNTHRYRFQECLTSECMVFRVEFVFTDPGMTLPEHEKPFLCKDREKIWSKLRGAQFDITDKMQTMNNTYCVWAGPYCGFDDMIEFINQTSRTTYYKFIAAGLLFNLQYRRSEHAIPSEPLTDDKLHVVGPLRETAASFDVAWKTMWQPFTRRAWFFLFGSVGAVALLRLLISVTYTRPLEFWRVLSNALGDYEQETQYQFNGDLTNTGNVTVTHDPSPDGRRMATLKKLNNSWANASKMGFLIMILFYEVALILSDAEPQLPFADLRPEKFVVIASSTEEYVTRQNVFKGLPPMEEKWKKRAEIQEVYQEISNTSNGVSFTVSYEKFNRNMFRQKPDRCAFSQIYKTDVKLPRLNGVWYYSRNVNSARRTEIDKEIMALRESGEIDNITNAYFGISLPTKCKPIGSRITFPLLALPLVFLPGPIFFYVFMNLMITYSRRSSRYFRTRRSRVGADAVQTQLIGKDATVLSVEEPSTDTTLTSENKRE